MANFLSHAEALEGVIEAEDIGPMVDLLQQHKNWGSFKARVPSYILVRLMDAIRDLRQHGADYYDTDEGESEDETDDQPDVW